MTGIERLRQVRSHVPDAGRITRKRLKAAAAEFEAACLADSADWPQSFRMRAGTIRSLLARHGGTDETVDRFGSAEVSEAVASLRTFCDEAERALGRWA